MSIYGRCLTGTKMNMTAQVLRQGVDPSIGDGVLVGGHYEYTQDPDSGATIVTWVQDTDPTAPGEQILIVQCMVRGISTGGVRGSATTEEFKNTGLYEKINYVKMTFPASIEMYDSDRVTNIRGPRHDVVWKNDDNTSTVFNVQGIIPVLDPFGRVVEKTALLERSQIQGTWE